jgi:hypothetical protein
MKTALAIDSLLLRDESIFLVELALNLFPDAEIYTIAHRRGSILGTIETHPIVSSFLTHKVRDASTIQNNFWLLPSAVKGIPIHPSIKKVIILSRGYIQGLNLPPGVEKYLYILDWNLVEQNSLGWQKFFRHYVNDWREKSLTKFPKIAVSSHTLQSELHLPNAEVIEPTFKTEEYPFVKDEDHNFLFDHQLVYTHGLKLEEMRNLLKILTAAGDTVRILGPNAHLDSLKKEYPAVEWAGDHCEATNALYSHQAKAVWDFSEGFFPAKSFGAFATGRPVVSLDRKISREFLTQGAYFLKDFSLESIKAIRETIEGEFGSVDRRVLRRLGLKWNERLFKSRLAKFFEV